MIHVSLCYFCHEKAEEEKPHMLSAQRPHRPLPVSARSSVVYGGPEAPKTIGVYSIDVLRGVGRSELCTAVVGCFADDALGIWYF